MVIPKNIHLLFLPPDSPELNPVEMIWRYTRGKTTNIIFKDFEELSATMSRILSTI
ncbi:MAG: transposase [Sphingobacteriales bacterium]|nr:transposase [Sphingobacteriales bacterium]